MAPRGRDIQHRCAVDRNSKWHQVSRDEATGQPSSFYRERYPVVRVAAGDRANHPGRWTFRPIWWPQALNPAAFLVDENGRQRIIDCLAQFSHQAANLFRRPAVAREEDKSKRPHRAKKGALALTETLASTPENNGRTRR